MKKLVLLLCLVGLLSQYSCSLLLGGAKTVTIEDVSFYIENIPTDRWSADSPRKPSLVYHFEVFFKEDLAASDIKSVKIYLPNNSSAYWNIDVDYYFNEDSKSVGGTTYCTSSSSLYELPIGTMRAEIVLENGKNDSYDFTMGMPGSLSTGGNSYVFSAEDEGAATYPLVSTPAIKRPIVSDLSFVGEKLSTTFTVKGDNVRNGWIWYYGTDGRYIGRSVSFANQVTNTSSTKFSAGFFLSAAESQNTLVLDSGDIVASNGMAISLATMNTIAHCRVYLTDGSQYTGPSKVMYDYGAMSPLF